MAIPSWLAAARPIGTKRFKHLGVVAHRGRSVRPRRRKYVSRGTRLEISRTSPCGWVDRAPERAAPPEIGYGPRALQYPVRPTAMWSRNADRDVFDGVFADGTNPAAARSPNPPQEAFSRPQPWMPRRRSRCRRVRQSAPRARAAPRTGSPARTSRPSRPGGSRRPATRRTRPWS